MSDRTEIAKEFAKIMLDGMLLVLSLLAMYGAIVFVLFTWFAVPIGYSLLLSSAILVATISAMAAIQGSYFIAKQRVEKRKRQSS
jgi:uncharacterized membrane-anchored protein